MIGADLLCRGADIELLLKIMSKLLNIGGKACIINTQRGDNQDSSQ